MQPLPTTLGSDDAIVAEGLHKRFGQDKWALRGLDLRVATGSIVGLLGPNGAGKTTTVRVLTTLMRPDSGRASVAGFDVDRDPIAVRARIGLTGQYAAIDELLTGRGNLVMVGRLNHLSAKVARHRADELLERFDLAAVADKRAASYSGGMRRRLDLAASLVAAPPVLFLDEPTTGLDPQNRHEMWALLSELVTNGTTVLLTTQYLEEADQLADRIAVIDHGRVVAEGTPATLKAEIGGDRLEIAVNADAHLPEVEEVLRRVGHGDVRVDAPRMRSVAVTHGTGALTEAVRSLDAAGVEPEDIAVRRPTLDEVFLALTNPSDTKAA